MSEPSRRSPGRLPEEAEVTWTEEALERVEKAPAFVRPGIRKLMQKRARELGQSVITSEFLTQIRNEAMLRVSRSMKKFGFEDLRMEAFEAAKAKMARNVRKAEVIEEIKRFLAGRTSKNEEILERFRAYFQNLPDRGTPWTPEARERLEKLPPAVAAVLARSAEEEARRRKEKVVSPQLLEAAWKDFRPGGRPVGETEGCSPTPEEGLRPAHPEEGSAPVSLDWAEEALQRLHRIPFQFARNLVVRKAEACARSQGVSKVTLDIYLQAAELPARFPGKWPEP